MSPETFISLFRETLVTTLLVSAPMLICGLLAGLLISIFQAVTSIHEMTLTFIPKILAVAIALLVFLPWMMAKLLDFTSHLLINLLLYIH
jgi:flagellar biosynthetic protein FliQ